ncbi:hypothetical protein HK098_006309 [Nowakowskiella sp. JEL0407]|nr:hypothetical protein HK098_006309 [Nowakowskiella sp. JEL0407]
MQGKVNWSVNGKGENSTVISFGKIPIMVRSSKCHLYNKSPKELIAAHEDADEFGGYFIINGNERLLRLLVVPRRNHAIALVRPAFQNRGPTYTQFGVQIRCTRTDQTSQSFTIHYCSDGNIIFRFGYKKQEYMVPVMLVLRALKSTSDKEIFERLTMGRESDTFLTDRVELLLRGARGFGRSMKECREYIGSKFFVMLDSPDDETSEGAGEEFLRSVVCVHLKKDNEKFDLLIYMIQKLYALVAGDICQDNPDSPQNWEVLLGGHLYLMFMKDKLRNFLEGFKRQIQTDIRRTPASVDFHDKKYIEKVLKKSPSDIGQMIQYLLATGNANTDSGLDLQQVSGFTVVAEKLNFYRFISHFRAIHRGAFFNEIKTTTVRKLLPEAWGFLCPVHTPDGAPCGLLNHLSSSCEVLCDEVDVGGIEGLVEGLGVNSMVSGGPRVGKGSGDDMEVDEDEEDDEEKVVEGKMKGVPITVQLDGRVIGWCGAKIAKKVADTLRYWKVEGINKVPLTLEIALVLPSNGGQYPGLFLFSTPARMMRPVTYIVTGKPDMVGSYEQVYMDIACTKGDIVPGQTTHIEGDPTNILSIVANMTPFSDFNQSPRNMYQCQMGKQAMGTPAHNFPHRTDNKMYRIQTGQSPIVRPKLYNEYGLDSYPNGVNAVVAVIAYTGYDMEDASIVSKGAHERGYGYGTVYKTEYIDLKPQSRMASANSTKNRYTFGLVPPDGGQMIAPARMQKINQFIDLDGLPYVGTKMTFGDPLYAVVDNVTGKVDVKTYKMQEDGIVDSVILCAPDQDSDPLQKIAIKYRIPRPPVVGDKFSSRHGQKGVISQKWPSVDMPFSESGIIPDVIINPHAFPSRMTIGMFVESLAGKSGALHGTAQDATPFTFSEEYTAADHFGEQLKAAGYNFHGNEPMYSGITGKEFKADIYIGVVYYQRLRHMVSDKYQVRTTGPVHNLTQQPIKGRKRAGGIRFGEMERDSLLAHGTSFLLQDRLMNCSDYTQSFVCKICGGILGVYDGRANAAVAVANGDGGVSEVGNGGGSGAMGIMCKTCETGKGIDVIAIPYVFRYLCTELAAMGVKLKLEVE